MEEIEKVLFTEEQIKRKVKGMAKKICDDFRDCQSIIGVSVLLGSATFFSDLVNEISRLNGPKIISDSIQISSYEGRESTGNAKIIVDIHQNVKGKEIILIEDIVDTGTSINYLINHIKEVKGAQSVKVCSLLSKPSRRKVEVAIDYLGFEIPDEFVVGYGLDYNQKYRDLPYIGILKR